jgi:hypothetical protein
VCTVPTTIPISLSYRDSLVSSCAHLIRQAILVKLYVSSTDNEIITDVPESEDQDEQIPEINEFLFWQTPDDLDDDDDDPEEQEEASQEEFPNS